jgi:hypothetical protein
MDLITLIVLAPTLIGVVLGIVVGLLLGCTHMHPPGTGRALTVLAGAVPLVAQGLVTGLGATSAAPASWSEYTVQRFLYAFPLALTVLAVLVLCVPGRQTPTGTHHTPVASADLTPRTVGRFLPRLWIVVLMVLVLVEVVATVIAGRASEPDEQGRRLLYTVSLGSTSASTDIYGWYLSTPSLVVLAALVIVSVAALLVAVRRSVPGSSPAGEATRRSTCLDIARTVSGGLLVHLGIVLEFLGGTARLFLIADNGEDSGYTGTSFAALGPALTIAGVIATILGIALWTLVAVVGMSPHRNLAHDGRPGDVRVGR